MKEKIKCFSRLLEKALEFDHDEYFIDLDISVNIVNNVWVALREKVSDESKIVFCFCYERLSIEDIKVLTDKIIKLLGDIEECTNIENIKAKLPLEDDKYVDIKKFIKGDK
ncbi:MAG: hypothetical protein Q4F63_07455 [Clostridia bacterium]|nr:hypothetical protein [Clostridia bacterium]